VAAAVDAAAAAVVVAVVVVVAHAGAPAGPAACSFDEDADTQGCVQGGVAPTGKRWSSSAASGVPSSTQSTVAVGGVAPSAPRWAWPRPAPRAIGATRRPVRGAHGHRCPCLLPKLGDPHGGAATAARCDPNPRCRALRCHTTRGRCASPGNRCRWLEYQRRGRLLPPSPRAARPTTGGTSLLQSIPDLVTPASGCDALKAQVGL